MLVYEGTGGEKGQGMARQRQTVEEIINKLREAEVSLSKGMAVPTTGAGSCRALARLGCHSAWSQGRSRTNIASGTVYGGGARPSSAWRSVDSRREQPGATMPRLSVIDSTG